MAAPKTIAVLGATGNQGGSVATTLLQDGWKVRAITRNPSSAKAQSLASRGAEVVKADLDDPASLEAAFQGAHAVFSVSDFWGIYGDPVTHQKAAAAGKAVNVYTGEHETQQLKNTIDAAAKSGSLERFIISSLSHASKWSKGKYTHVYHFDSKALAEEYARETYPSLWAKTSVYQAGLFASNFIKSPLATPKKNANGVLEFPTILDADVKLPFVVAEEDSGPVVKALLNDQPGKNVIGYREWVTLREFVQLVAGVTGLETTIKHLPNVQALGVPEDLAQEIEDNFAYFKDFGYEARDDPTVVHPNQLREPPSLGKLVDYLKKQDWVALLG